MQDVFGRLHRTKMILSCLVLVALGITLLAVQRLLDDVTGWLRLLPLGEVGGIVVVGGLLSIPVDAYLRNVRSTVDRLNLSRLLDEHTPAFVDATIRSFAAKREDLKRVATPEFLDQLISNSLALRLGDEQFASEIYTDIRDQAIQASERWHDASLSIDLKPLPMGRGAPTGSTPSSTTGPFFLVTVRWEYTTVPQHAQRRFACVSDRDEYAELAAERGATSAWFMQPGSGIEANHPDAFQLLRFTVDGEDRPIRRSERKTSQTYTASLGADVVKAGEPVTITYTYQLRMARTGHLLFFDIEQPTRDLRVDFGYADCAIASVSVLDLVPSVRPTRIERPPEGAATDTIRVNLDGWIFPRSGVAFVWTLEGEILETRSR